MININGVNFEFDAYDADDLEKANKEMQKVTNSMYNPPKNADRLTLVKYTVKAVSDCFDNIFGEGAAKKIFKGKTNMRLALKCFAQLTDGIQKQDNEFEKELKDIKEKYSPNRVSRRNNKHHNKKK